MKNYKVVPCQGKIIGKTIDDAVNAIPSLASIITQESVGGWQLVSVMPVTACNKKRGLKAIQEPYNALIFAREEIADIPDAKSKSDKKAKSKKNSDE